jgi:hypothetical protein
MVATDALLAGKRLIPFWRDCEKGEESQGVFTQLRTFDAVLGFQGTAAVPYVEEGPKGRPDVWDRLWWAFEGNLLLSAAWLDGLSRPSALLCDRVSLENCTGLWDFLRKEFCLCCKILSEVGGCQTGTPPF